MINLGEVYCRWCGDAFEPEGYVGEDGAFCSDGCEATSEAVEYGRQEYNEARYGGAAVFES